MVQQPNVMGIQQIISAIKLNGVHKRGHAQSPPWKSLDPMPGLSQVPLLPQQSSKPLSV